MDERSSRHALEVIDRMPTCRCSSWPTSWMFPASSRRLTLDIRPVDLGSVIGAALDSVRPAADAKRIRIRVSLAPSARLLEGDPPRLQQIIWNLLANAVKFTPVDGVVDVRLVDAGHEGVRLSVADNGEGIDPAFLPHVFERFNRAQVVSRQHGGWASGGDSSGTSSSARGGSGAQEGRAGERRSRCAARDDEPSQAVSVAAPVIPPPVGRHAPSLAGCRILVVDDEPDARELLALILTAAGATVVTASSVNEALPHFDGSTIDVVLTDIGMPGEDGLTLIREVRRRETVNGRRMRGRRTARRRANRDRSIAAADRHGGASIRPPSSQ